MENLINDLNVNQDIIQRIVMSKPGQKDEEKLTIRPILLKGEKVWQAESVINNKAYHQNLTFDEMVKLVNSKIVLRFKAINIVCIQKSISYDITKKGKIFRREDLNKVLQANLQHDKEKSYILQEGEHIEAFVDLGIFSSDYKLIKGMKDKFVQINKFIENIDSVYKNISSEKITILDFGCGKSYLTFFVYYYFNVLKKCNVKIIGYDIKEDVVVQCNNIAKKYNYENLVFEVNDVSHEETFKNNVDIILTLHACDTATDYALFYAIKHKVKHIFSVPCCQHEVNLSIEKGQGDFDIFLKHGLIKERFCALLTDSIRVEVLENYNYKVDVIEFVDESYTPKNMMLRATLNSKSREVKLDEVMSIKQKYNFNQKLLELIANLENV